MKKLALILTLILIPVFALAQTSGKLSGIVTGDGQPLVGANVLVKGTTFGAATDENGRYYILDVPIGAFEVEAQYIGYKTLTISNVRVNANQTKVMNFTLEVAAVEGETVQVTAERPLVQTATNSTSIIDKEVLQALAVRDVGDMIALQAGAVGGNVRGGRDNDNAYYIDGVLMKNRWSGGNLAGSLSQQSMTEISFQAGGFSAEYGGANGGVVTITTNSGSNKFSGSAEFLTDLGSESPGEDKDKLYSYGKKLYNFTLGGPISNNIRFYTMIESDNNADYAPSFTSSPFMDHEIFNQSEWTAKGYDTLYTWEEGDFPQDVIYYDQVIRDNQTNIDSLIDGVADYDTTHILGSNYRNLYGQKRTGEDKDLTYLANIEMDFRPFRVKLGIGGYDYESNPYNHTSHLMNWDTRGYEYNAANRYMYANATWSISPRSYLKIIASNNSYEQFYFNDLSDHGTKDDATKSKFTEYGIRSKDIGSTNYYLRRDGRNPLAIGDLVLFSNYGLRYDDYQQRFQDSKGVRLDYLNQWNVHELKAGMEYYNTEISWYRIAQPFEVAERTSLLDVDFDGVISPDEVQDQNGDGVIDSKDVDTWRFYTYRNAYVDNLGYDIFGKKSSKDDPWGSDPGKAIESRFYVQDKIELKDVIVQLGLTYESYDPNAYAPAGEWNADDNEWTEVGYGTAEGFRNLHMTGGYIDKTGDQDGSLPWKKVKKESAILPRIGFSFPVTDLTVFRANYGVYWQAPPLQYVYLTDAGLTANSTQGNMTVSENPALKPEKTTTYEVGISQQIGQIAALDVAGYYKESRDYLMMKNHPLINGYSALMNGGETSWAQYMNGDYGVTQGFSASLSMRRFNGILTQVNYTYMTARGTGSEADDNFDIAWTGETYPTTINRLAFDQKHTGSAMLDYRHPMGIGFNAVYTFGSGQAYTPTIVQSEVFGRGWDIPIAAINSGDKPWVSRMDLRVDYNLKLAGANVNVYLLALNVLNNENTDDVYDGSGQVADDAWLKSAEGVIWVKSQEDTYPATKGLAENLYINRLSSPTRWEIPRIVRLGIQVNI